MTASNFLPKSIQLLTESKISFDRIQQFLLLGDMSKDFKANSDTLFKDSKDSVIVAAKSAYFGWSPSERNSVNPFNPSNDNDKVSSSSSSLNVPKAIPSLTPMTSPSKKPDYSDMTMDGSTLHNISFAIERGSLVGIVGEVGSGKSSILNALLGEMHILSGQSGIVHGTKIAYVPQTPWVLGG